MTRSPRIPLILALLLLLLTPGAAWARYGSDGIRLLPGGIVFPGFDQSVSMDPAALPDGHATALEIDERPALLDRTDNDLGATIATSNGTAGIGAGYGRTDYPNGLGNNQQLYAGGGFGFDSVRLGLGFSTGVGGGGGSSVMAGLILGGDKDGFRFAGVVNQLNSAPDMTLGLGYGKSGSYNLEANLAFPSFQSGLFSTGSVYSLFLDASIYSGSVGLGIDGKYNQAWGSGYGGSWLWGVTGMLHPSSWPAMMVRYTTFRDLTFSLVFLL